MVAGPGLAAAAEAGLAGVGAVAEVVPSAEAAGEPSTGEAATSPQDDPSAVEGRIQTAITAGRIQTATTAGRTIADTP